MICIALETTHTDREAVHSFEQDIRAELANRAVHESRHLFSSGQINEWYPLCRRWLFLCPLLASRWSDAPTETHCAIHHIIGLTGSHHLEHIMVRLISQGVHKHDLL